jgi:hypothetical protein
MVRGFAWVCCLLHLLLTPVTGFALPVRNSFKPTFFEIKGRFVLMPSDQDEFIAEDIATDGPMTVIGEEKRNKWMELAPCWRGQGLTALNF